MLSFLQQLADTNSKNEKAKILQGLSPTQRQLFIYALDPMRIYFYQMPPSNLPPSVAPHVSDEAASKIFIDLLDLLRSRIITGSAAHEMVRTTFMKFTKEQQNWFARVLNKDLKVGVEAKSYLAVHKGDFEVFETQLCEDWEESIDVAGWTAEIKYDGLRAVACVSNHGVEFLSRNGKPIYGNEHLHVPLQAMLKRFTATPNTVIWLDGELKGGGFNESVSVIRSSKNKKDPSSVFYYVFDMLVGGPWQKGRSTEPIEERRRNLAAFFGINDMGTLREGAYHNGQLAMTGQITMRNNADVHHYFQNALDKGHEGLILKRPKSVYKWSRNKDWLKIKSEKSEELTVVGFYEGERGTKRECKLGGLIGRRANGVDVNVGGGYSDDILDELWRVREKLPGKVIEAAFQEETPDGSLRHPRFKRFREDKE